MKTRILLALIGFVIVFAASQKSQAQMPVTTCGQTLDTQGEYVLMNDLNCNAAAGDVVGVYITASNVTFHLAGQTISSSVCDLNRTVIGVFAVGGITNVKIDGGNISGFNSGVQLSASNSQVKGMQISGACLFGIGVQSDGNHVVTNNVSGSSDGVLLLNATNAHVRSNYLWNNVRAAVISGTTSGSFVEDNIINNNDSYGVAVINGSNNTVRDNSVNNNRNGIFIDSPNNRVIENIVNRSLDVGVSVGFNGSPSVVRRNAVYRSGNADMTDDRANCGGNNWRNNNFLTDLVNGVSDGGPNAGCIR